MNNSTLSHIPQSRVSCFLAWTLLSFTFCNGSAQSLVQWNIPFGYSPPRLSVCPQSVEGRHGPLPEDREYPPARPPGPSDDPSSASTPSAGRRPSSAAASGVAPGRPSTAPLVLPELQVEVLKLLEQLEVRAAGGKRSEQTVAAAGSRLQVRFTLKSGLGIYPRCPVLSHR